MPATDAFIGSQPLHGIPTPQSASQNVSKIVDQFQKLQVSVFLPNDLSLDDWCAGVLLCPLCSPDVSMMGAAWSAMSTTYDVPSMWGNILGQYPLRLAITAAAPGNQGAWLVPAWRKRRAALYQQI